MYIDICKVPEYVVFNMYFTNCFTVVHCRYSVERVLVARTDKPLDHQTGKSIKFYDLNVIIKGLKTSDIEQVTQDLESTEFQTECQTSGDDDIVGSMKLEDNIRHNLQTLLRPTINQLLASLQDGSYESIKCNLSKIEAFSNIECLQTKSDNNKYAKLLTTSELGEELMSYSEAQPNINCQPETSDHSSKLTNQSADVVQVKQELSFDRNELLPITDDFQADNVHPQANVQQITPVLGEPLCRIHFYSFKCMFCHSAPEFENWKNLREHIVDTHFTKDACKYTLKCPYGCSKVFTFPIANSLQHFKLMRIIFHMKSKHNIALPDFIKVLTCPEPRCYYQHLYYGDLKSHLMKKHRIQQSDLPDPRALATMETMADMKQYTEDLDDSNALDGNIGHNQVAEISADSIKAETSNEGSGDSPCPLNTTHSKDLVVKPAEYRDKVSTVDPSSDHVSKDEPQTTDEVAMETDDEDNIVVESGVEISQLHNSKTKISSHSKKSSGRVFQQMTYTEIRCALCKGDPEFTTSAELTKHIRATHFVKLDNGRYEMSCPQALCQKNFIFTYPEKEIWRILFHNQSRHNVGFPMYMKVLHCPQAGCSYTHLNQRSLNIHVKETHQKKKSIVCDLCGGLIGAKYYKMHVKYHCNASAQKLQREKVKCPHCPKQLQSEHLLKVHIAQIHSGERRVVVCHICSRTCPDSSSLNNHLWMGHGQNPKGLPVLKCPLCSFDTLYKGKLASHHRRNHLEHHSSCDLCGEEFRSHSKSSVRLYIQILGKIPSFRGLGTALLYTAVVTDDIRLFTMSKASICHKYRL